MHGPEEADLVVPAMEPVIQEVFCQQEEKPVGEYVGDRYPMMIVAKLEDEEVDTAEQEIDRAVEKHQVKVAQCIAEGIELAMPVIAEENLQANDNKIQRCADQQQYLLFEVFHALKILDFSDLYSPEVLIVH